MQDNVRKPRVPKRILRIGAALLFTLFATCAYSASKTVLVLGDSLSAEYGLERGSGWVSLLEKRLKNNKIDATIVNASVSGETTSGGKVRLPALLDQYRPDIVVLELGANDGLRGLPIKSAKENLRDMIDISYKAKAKVLLVGMQLPPNYGRDYIQKFSAVYKTLAKEEKLPLVPFLLEGVASRPELFQADRLHPLADAQPIILSNVWPYLKALLLRK